MCAVEIVLPLMCTRHASYSSRMRSRRIGCNTYNQNDVQSCTVLYKHPRPRMRRLKIAGAGHSGVLLQPIRSKLSVLLRPSYHCWASRKAPYSWFVAHNRKPRRTSIADLQKTATEFTGANLTAEACIQTTLEDHVRCMSQGI